MRRIKKNFFGSKTRRKKLQIFFINISSDNEWKKRKNEVGTRFIH